LKTLTTLLLQLSVSVIQVFVAWQGSRPLSASGVIPPESAFGDLSYW
jgi:hypothetical protein